MAKRGMNLVERLVAPTSKFFRTIRNTGVCLVAAGGAIVATPVTLPAWIVAIAGYLTVAGSVMTAVAQATVESD